MKGQKEIEKKNVVLEKLRIEYIPVGSIKPNAYNPNRQSEHDFELLLRSMREDGFTQPIICQRDGTIVDGEHRWRASQKLGYAEVPVVYVDMTPEQMRIATLRHNRARGSEDVELTAQVLRDLQQLGAVDWAQDSLMLDDTEMQNLLQNISASDALASPEFGKAWVPSTVGAEVSPEDGTGTTEAVEVSGKGQKPVVVAMSAKAVEDQRATQAAIREAKSEEEKAQITKDRDLFHINLLFSGDEGKLVRGVLGDRPAEKLLEMCRNSLQPS